MRRSKPQEAALSIATWREEGSNPALPTTGKLRALLLVALVCLGLAAAFPRPAAAIGPNAVRYPSGWNTNAVARGDDTANLVVNLPFTMNWMGNNYTQLYLNMNGNVTFSSGFVSYQPAALTSVGQGIMAPFWADVDTRFVGSPNLLYYSNLTSGSVPTINGHKAILITWSAVQYYNNGNTTSQTTTDTFQLVIIDRSDTGAGNFDFEYNYDQMLWDMGTASTTHARAGWAVDGTTSYELPGSGTSGALLDSGPSGTSLIQNYQNPDGQLGRYVWQVRSGVQPNQPPLVSVTNRLLEGNVSGGYLGYTGAGDATASDADGYVASLQNTLPALLPVGTTNVLWTATDDDGAVTTQTQSVTVTDTSPPSKPGLSSPTTALGVWTKNNVVSINGTGVVDACTGLAGFSYSWSKNATSAPDTATDTITTTTVTASNTTTVTTTTTFTVNSQTFPTATWPGDWTRSDATYVRLTNTAGRFHDTYAAEAWTNANGTRRTVNFYRDYNLAGYTTANVSFWDQASAMAGGGDYANVDYSTDGGTTWHSLQALSAASAWAQWTYALPVGGTVRVRFSASVNATTEYADWDDITVTGFVTTSTPVVTKTTTTSLATTSTLGDGVWYFNVRSVDKAGNWSGTTSIGPFYIDTAVPVTTSNAPSKWVTSSPVPVSLTATDSSGGPIAYTKYSLNGGSVTTYTAAVSVSTNGTNTIQYFSADAAGNVESTETATVRIDPTPPTVPASPSAAAVSTTSVEVTWAASTDAISGVAYYGVYRDGSLLATSAGIPYTATGLNPGQTYSWQVSAFDVAGNESTRSVTVTAAPPAYAYKLSITTANDPLDFGSIDPGTPASIPTATIVELSGIGNASYTLSCSATDFSNLSTASLTPTMPAGLMSFTTRGQITKPSTPFATSAVTIDPSGAGSKYSWVRDYFFDFSLTIPYNYDPTGTYQSKVTYTAVIQ